MSDFAIPPNVPAISEEEFQAHLDLLRTNDRLWSIKIRGLYRKDHTFHYTSGLDPKVEHTMETILVEATRVTTLARQQWFGMHPGFSGTTLGPPLVLHAPQCAQFIVKLQNAYAGPVAGL